MRKHKHYNHQQLQQLHQGTNNGSNVQHQVLITTHHKNNGVPKHDNKATMTKTSPSATENNNNNMQTQ